MSGDCHVTHISNVSDTNDCFPLVQKTGDDIQPLQLMVCQHWRRGGGRGEGEIGGGGGEREGAKGR